MREQAPVFIVGSSRSGTTLLYSILISSGEFPVYQAETKLLSDCQAKYGNLNREYNRKRFLDDWFKSRQFIRSGLVQSKFEQEVKGHTGSYLDFLVFFMSSIAKKQGKRRWCEKTPEHVFFMRYIKENIPEALFIHIIRDGRDVAISKRKLGWSGLNNGSPINQLLFASITWEQAVKRGRLFGKILGDDYLEIHYEELVLNLASSLKRINTFCGLDLTEKQIIGSTIGSIKRSNSAFDKDVEPISTSPINRWQHLLSQEELLILNKNIGELLKELGYKVGDEADCSPNLSFFDKFLFRKKVYIFLYNLKSLLKNNLGFGRYSSAALELDIRE